MVLYATVHTKRDKNISSGLELVFQFSDIASGFAGMLFLGHFPQGNGSLNMSILYIVTLQHVVKWLFYFVKYKILSYTKAFISYTNR